MCGEEKLRGLLLLSTIRQAVRTVDQKKFLTVDSVFFKGPLSGPLFYGL